MQIKLHKNARTTLAIRKEIKESSLSAYALSKKYGISQDTARKWKNAKSIEDKSSRPYHLNTTLTKEQEDLICFERKQFKKTIDDIYLCLESKISNLYPMKVYRCLKRHNLSVLPGEFQDAERKTKKFRKYTIGYLHIDILYAPKINKQRKYIFTAIDRVNKIAYIFLGKTKTKEDGAKFLQQVLKFYPYKINYILTDNGGEFTYKGLPKNKRPKDKIHPFDKICQENKIEHRTIKFRHPWTNGMIESLNKKIKNNVFRIYQFQTIFDLENKLLDYIDNYNHNIRLKSINYKTPNQYLKEKKNLEIPFIKEFLKNHINYRY